jgi:hypothetical protein
MVFSSAELCGAAPQPGIAGAPVDAIEFYNAAQDHHFMTPSALPAVQRGIL